MQVQSTLKPPLKTTPNSPQKTITLTRLTKAPLALLKEAFLDSPSIPPVTQIKETSLTPLKTPLVMISKKKIFNFFKEIIYD